jgi:ubiquinone/menaquinone biosynthesis C-methylase UbiE
MTQDLHSYYVNLHRDWAWGVEENRRSCELVAEALGPERRRVLVLGAGGGRLAYDLHAACAPSLTVALDINPLLLLVAKELLDGNAVSLIEFPIAPRHRGDEAVARELRAPEPSRPGLELVFGDAWQAPFKPQSFDAVITPWLVDIVDLDFDSIAAHVNRLLVMGGRWVNFGSLAFPWRRPALRLGRDELSPALDEAGFETATIRDEVIPYMRSPASRHSRLEEVLVFAADKRRRGPREPEPPRPPAWLEQHGLPVPRVGPLALAADASRVQALTLALIDGQRSIDDLVRVISEQRLLPPEQARSAVCGLFERLIASAERG